MTFPDPGFSTPAMAEIFTAERKVAGLLSFEVSLARARADLGLVPREVAEEIATSCQDFDGDPSALLASAWERGSPLIDLLEILRSRLSEEAGAVLHQGSTSQDAIDTALMLQIRDAVSLLGSQTEAVINELAVLASRHDTTPYTARTLLQVALPSTLGNRASAWSEPLIRGGEELRQVGESLPVQLGGPIGNSESLGSPELAGRLAAHLGLTAPARPWHTDRSYVRRPVGVAVEIALAAGKIAFDLALLSGLGEVSMRAGESSSMAHKRNPIDAIRAVAAGRACVAAASALWSPGGNELERGVGGWQVEWWSVPLVFQAAAAALDGIKASLAQLEVSAD
ncbi:MAG TPA: lyase family protein [Acidimicrobiia bacterium]|nr:lyase family protein [Acidimicrobiia bacterium]